jgi:hypothetical protein
MNARKMFEELGYEIYEEDKFDLVYSNCYTYIKFDKANEEYTQFDNLELNHEIGYICAFTTKEHQAITQQMKELGWLDD